MSKLFKGLTTSEVEESRKKYGSNVIVEAEPPTFWEAFMEGFGDPMIKILCGISVLMIVLYVLGLFNVIPPDSVSWFEPVGTIVAIVLVNFISAKTSLSSDKAYRKLKNSTKKDTVKVYRDGVVAVVEVDDIVVGDIVILQSGDKIPADGVLVQGGLRVNNSALNGEAEECKKFEAPEGFTIPEEITGDTFTDKHSLFKGAIVYNGEGLMEIQKVGMKTMMGKMAEDMADAEETSPLKEKLGVLAGQISKFGYAGAILISIAYLIHFVVMAGGFGAWIDTGWIEVLKSVIEAVMVAIVIIVCAVPEGLPLMISLVLMQNTGRLLEHNCLVRKAVGIETAGSINILFSDKTGTITKGELDIEAYKDVFIKLKEKFDFKYIGSTLRESYSASDNGWSALIYDGKEFYRSKKYDIHLVDRGGGGASFAAGMIYGLLNNMSLADTCEFATAASALKQTITGDFNLATLEEVKRLMGGDASGRVQR